VYFTRTNCLNPVPFAAVTPTIDTGANCAIDLVWASVSSRFLVCTSIVSPMLAPIANTSSTNVAAEPGAATQSL
jgi:hypothetical protein